MPFIEFPNVPFYPGVPSLLRSANSAVAQNVPLSIALGSVKNVLGGSFQQQVTQWGIFNQDGTQLGVDIAGNSVIASLSDQLTGASSPLLSTVSFDYTRETTIADFPVEGGGFANYNKVVRPANPVVSLALTGSESDRSHFLLALDLACKSVNLYNVVTPEVVYVDYSLERMSVRRTASRGQTLIVVEVSLKEIRQVSAAYTQVSAIKSPISATATPTVDAGKVQPTAMGTSTLKSLASKLGF